MTGERLKWLISGIDFGSLTEWEEKFVCSLESYFERNGELTEKQEELIEGIYREKGI